MKKDLRISKTINELEKINNHSINRVLVQLKKEINIFEACNSETSEKIEQKVKEQLATKKSIQIGGGRCYLEGFINIDIQQPADIVYDIRIKIPLPSNSVNFIFTEHFLEHIDYPNSVLRFFSEAYRVLSAKGRIVVGVPDSGLIAKAYASNNTEFLQRLKQAWYSKRTIYNDIDLGIDLVSLAIRDQDADEVYNPHFWGYDETKLISLFEKFGFVNIKKMAV